MRDRATAVRGIAHQHIKDRRAERAVPVAAGGTLADYVPFYFGPRSPMLYTIHRGNVEGFDGRQGQVVHLVVQAEAAMGCGRPWCFTDGHAEMAVSRFHADWAERDCVDWPLMKQRYWSDTADEPDRKRRRQAEFLLHGACPVSLIAEVGVYDSVAKEGVEAVAEQHDAQWPVRVMKDWYY